MTAATRVTRAGWRLLVGPVLLLAGLGLLKGSDELGGIGPLDRAAFGWAVPVPLLLLAPAAIGVAARSSGPTVARRSAAATGLILGLSVGIGWFSSTKQVGCNQDPDTLIILIASIPVPLVLGLGWAGAGWLSIAFADRPLRAFLAGVGGAILAGVAMLATWGLLFPLATCAYVPPPA